jgi:hypothetical protein
MPNKDSNQSKVPVKKSKTKPPRPQPSQGKKPKSNE